MLQGNLKITERYQVLFYEQGSILYYITNDKQIVKMREKVRNYSICRIEAPMTNDDYEMIKSKFNIDEVYEEKILNFRKNRGVRPKREVESRWL